jgi:hypothetical protein
VLISVLFVAGLIASFFGGIGIALSILQVSSMFGREASFWIGVAAIMTAYLTTFALLYFAAAGMITFSSENRSTPLRIVMLAQQACWIGWMGFAWIVSEYEIGVVAFTMMMAAMYWYFMGAFLTSERTGMSQRVKRALPQSFLGRVVLTWLNPGPASGYMFVIANATAIALMAVLAFASGAKVGTGAWPSTEQVVYLMLVGVCYLVAYLGVGLLAIAALRRVAVVPVVGGVLIHAILLLFGTGAPLTIQMMSVELRRMDYSFLQITNPFWTLKYLASRSLPVDANPILLLTATAAVCVLLANLPGVLRELRQVRIARPARVAEDEQVLHPEPPPEPANPWDA